MESKMQCGMADPPWVGSPVSKSEGQFRRIAITVHCIAATLAISCGPRMPSVCQDFFDSQSVSDAEKHFAELPPRKRIEVYECAMTKVHPRNLKWRDLLASDGIEIVPHLVSYLKDNPGSGWLVRDVFQSMVSNNHLSLSQIDDGVILDLEKHLESVTSEEHRQSVNSVILFLRKGK